PRRPLQFPKARTRLFPGIVLCSSLLILKAIEPAWRMPDFLYGSLSDILPQPVSLNCPQDSSIASSDSQITRQIRQTRGIISYSMPLKKNTKSTPADGFVHGFDQARLDRLTASMQPLLTRNATEEELEALLKEAEDCLKVTTGMGGRTKRFQGWWTRNTKTTKTAKAMDITGFQEI
ncbi:hypothetical protein QBC45DRAFT_340699, partial [Copromyces sp. CBS 386.78]